jgi:hypothetical protein
MSHVTSLIPAPINSRVLFLGFLPEALSSEELAPLNMTVDELAARMESSWAAIQAEGVVGDMVGITKDPDEAEREVRRWFAEHSYGVAMIGGGVRLLPENTVLFERIVNVLIDLEPRIRLSFNIGPQNSLASVRRWLDRV